MTLEEKVKEINKDLQPLLKKHGLQMQGIPYSHIYKSFPQSVQLALKVLEEYQIQLVVGFKEIKEEIK